MDWPENLELTLDGIAQGGEGVGRWEGRVVFAGGGLPGERVRVRLHERHANFARGETVEALEQSPDRTPPRLPGATHMPWQHIAYPAQLRFKQQILAEQLEKIGGIDRNVVGETLPAAKPWGYRNTARLHVEHGHVGYHRAGSRRIDPIASDPLLLSTLNDALSAFRAVLRPRDAVSEVILRASETFGYVVAELRGAGDLASLARRWRTYCPTLAGVILPTLPHQGSDQVVEELGEIAFTIHPATFFQVNLAATRTLLQQTRAGLEPLDGIHLLDLYCGVGTFALPLAASAADVVGIEEAPDAVERAKANAAANGITNVRFLVGQVERELSRFDDPCDAVVLDPPRRGCHPKAIEELLRLSPERMVYVSCQPATLARDLKLLVAGGYQVKHVRPVDAFPQTAHIESVSVLISERT
jgi:23S rRNA (uracil1939-C5)-methyltransferase